MAYQYQHLKEPLWVMSGLADTLLFAPMDWLSLVRVPEGDGVNLETLITTATGNHEFYNDFGFIEVLLEQGKQSLLSSQINDLGYITYQHTLKGSIVGSYGKLHASLANLRNVPLLLLFKDSNCQSLTWYQLGTKCHPAYVTLEEFTTGSQEVTKAYTITIQSYYDTMIMYRGIPHIFTPSFTIITEDGDIILTENNHTINIES